MKNKKPNAEQVWKQLEDILVPPLRLSVTDRVVYSHLLRHSRLEGKLRIRFSIPWLARGTRLTHNPVRRAVRRLIARGALLLVERSKAGHIVEVRLPEEIPSSSRDSGPHRKPPRTPWLPFFSVNSVLSSLCALCVRFFLSPYTADLIYRG